MPKDHNTAFYRQGSHQIFDAMPLSVNWKLTNMCNYACSYCFGQYKLDKNRFSSWENIKTTVRNIAKLNRSSYRITLVGGEPTTHPHFLDLLQELANVLQDKLSVINIITNGSRSTKLFETLADVAQAIPVSLYVSIHSEFAQLSHIKELITKTANTANLSFKCMFNYNKFDYVKEICQDLIALREEYCFDFSITKLRIPPSFSELDPKYTQEHLAWEKDVLQYFQNIAQKNKRKNVSKNRFPHSVFYEKMIDGKLENVKCPASGQQMQKGFRNFTGMYCAMGTNFLRIYPNGQVNGAICGLSNRNSQSIFDEKFTLDADFVRLIQCSRKNCGCASDLIIPKFSDKKTAENFVHDLKLRHAQCLQAQDVPPETLFESLMNTFTSAYFRWKMRGIL